MDGPAAWRVLETDSVSGEPPPSGSDDAGGARRGRLVPVVLIGLAGLLALAALVVAAAGGHPEVSVEGTGSFDAAASSGSTGHAASAAASGSILVIDVQGAVARPGIVRLVAGSRVADAIAAAGGYGPRVASERVATALNLAALLHDGDQVIVPSRDDPSRPSGGPSTGGGSTTGRSTTGGGTTASQKPNGPLDLNTATAEALDTLPGIGPVTAAKIVAAREEQRFASVDDLRSRKLVGASTFDKLKDLVTVR